MQILLNVIWLLLPAALANASPPIFAKIFPKLDYPLDFYLNFNDKRVFGKHKTIRGMISAMIIGEVTYLTELNFMHQTLPNLPIYYGLAMGFSALLGDAVKSFFKRQLNITPGKSWFPFDQFDWIVASIICLNLWVKTDIIFFATALAVGFIAYLIVKSAGWFLKINDTYF